MADDIVSIIHKFSFQFDTSSIDQINQKFGEQLKAITDEKQKIAELEKQLASLGTTVGADFDELTRGINEGKKAIDAMAASTVQLIKDDKILQAQITKELELLKKINTTRENGVTATRKAKEGTDTLRRASFDLSQVLRELPAFAFSTQTGILAISNNLPILADSFGRLQTDAGGFGVALKQLLGTIFSFNNIFTIAIGLLAVFGDELFDTKEKTEEATTANDAYLASLKNLQDQSIKGYITETSKVSVLTSIIDNHNNSQEQRLSAAKQLREMYSGYFKDLTAEEILTNKAADAIKNLTEQIGQKDIYETRTAAASLAIQQIKAREDAWQAQTKAIIDARLALGQMNEDLKQGREIDVSYARTLRARVEAYENEGAAIQQLKIDRDSNLEAAARARLLASDILDKENKERQRKGKEYVDFTERLLKEIEALNKEYAQRQLSDSELNFQKRAALIEEAAAHELEQRLHELEQERNEILKNHALTLSDRQLLSEKERDIRRNSEQATFQQLSALRREYFDREKAIATQLVVERLNIEKAGLKLLQDTGADSLEKRQEIIDEETEIAVAASRDKYRKLIREAQLLSRDIEAILKQQQEEEENIIRNGTARKVDELEKYYRRQAELIEEDKRNQIAAIEANANFLTNTRRKEALVEREEAKKNMQAAEQFFNRTLSDPNATERDIQRAQTAFNESRVRYKDAINQVKQINIEMVTQALEAFDQLAQVAGGILNSIYQQQISLLDREIEYRQSRMEAAVELAEKGNTAILEAETKRLEDATRARELAARRQIQINAALQASEATVAAAQAISGVLGAANKTGQQLGIVGYIVAIVAAVAAVAGAILAIRNMFTVNEGASFAEGGYTGSGGKYQRAGIVHKGEYVINQAGTKMYRPYLEAMNKGAFPMVSMDYMTGSSIDKNNKQVLERLDNINESIQQNQVTVHNRMDEHGWYSMTERMKRRERRRWL